MKKTLSIIFSLFFLIGISPVGAEECNQSCKITDGPAPALTEYFTNVETLMQNVLEILSEAEKNPSNTTKEERNRVISSLNETLSFANHFGSFDFTIALPITNEVPQVVKRDHQAIQQISEKLTRVLETSEKRGTAGTLIENACEGVLNCSFPDGPARMYLTEMIKNNDKIAELYRASIMDKTFIAESEWFILVADDFTGQIEEYYNKDTLTSCSACKGGFMDRISERIKTISSFTSGAKEGIKAWKDAWTLMKWGRASPGYAEQEEILLAWYLQEQGIQTEQAWVVMDNLERYGSGGLSASNPLFNSANYAQVQIENRTKTFQEALEEKMAGEEKVPYVEVVRVSRDLRDTQDISQSISTLYEDLLPFSLAQDTGAQQLQGRIIRMHFSLMRSINMLDGQVESVEKLCDKQGTGMGKCSFQ